jgi:hypothetical protein
MRMQNQPQLTVVGRSNLGVPRTYRLARTKVASPHLDPARSTAYRRLVATILGLDVATLGSELRARRLRQAESTLAA